MDVSFRPPADRTIELTLSPDWRLVAAVTERSEVRLFDAGSGTLVRELAGLAPGRPTVFAPDGAALAAFADDAGSVRVWDVGSGEQTQYYGDWSAAGVWPDALGFTDDGRLLVAGASSAAGEVLVVGAATGETLCRVPADMSETVVRLSPDGRMLLVGGGAGATVWDVGTGQSQHTFPSPAEVTQVEFAPDGALVAVFGGDLLIGDTATGEVRHRFDIVDPGLRRAWFSPEGDALFLTADEDGKVMVVELASGRMTEFDHEPAAGVGALLPMPDGGVWVADTADFPSVVRYDKKGAAVAELPGYTLSLWSLAFSADGRWLAGATDDPDQAFVWEASTGLVHRMLTGHPGVVYGVAFSPDGRTVATAADDGVRLWDLATGESAAPLPGAALSVAFSPDGQLVAAGGADGSAMLWDAAGGLRARNLLGGTGPVWSIGFTPDGRTLLGADSAAVRRWDVASRTSRMPLLDEPASAIALSADGLVAIGTDKPALRVHRLGERRFVTGPARSPVYALALEPGGGRFASGGDDQNVYLHDATAPAEVSLLDNHLSLVRALAWSPDGRTVAVGCRNGTLHVWDVDEDQRQWVSVLLEDGYATFRADGTETIEGTPDGEFIL